MIPYFKYIRPSWYFNLVPDKNHIPYLCKVPDELKSFLDSAVFYQNDNSLNLDFGYQLWNSGFISNNAYEQLLIDYEKISVIDNYRLLARFSNKHWLFVAFVFRIFEFHNPFREILGLLQGLFVKKVNNANLKFRIKQNQNEKWEVFDSELIKSVPLVSVIIPTLNRYKYLIDVFKDLEKQTYKNFEVIVVDQTDDFDESVYQSWSFALKYWRQSEKALWLARNSAIKQSIGEFILLYDDDSLVESNWIESHLNCIDFYNCDISSGVSLSVIGDKIPEHYSYFRWSDQIDTGNVLLKRTVFEQVGLFDRQFEKQRMGDGEFGLRCYLNGFANISNPLAKRIHLKVGEGGLRQMGTWDAWRPKKFFAPRPIPSVLYLTRKYFGNTAAIREIIIFVFPSIVPYNFKRNKKMMIFGVVIGLVLSPMLIVSVFRSWRLSTLKLKQGERIQYL